MGGQKATTENDYKFFQKPGWQELTDFKNWNPQSDPSIPFNFGNQRNDFERSFVQPIGGYVTPEMQNQQKRSGLQQIGQTEAQARREDMYDQNKLKLGQLGQAAALAAPEFAQTKSTQKTGGGFGGFLSGLIGTAAQFK